MPRSITAPQTGSIVWYFSAAGAAPQAAIVTRTIDAAHFNLFVLSQAAVGSAVLNVLYSLVGQGIGQSVSAAAVAAGGTGYAVGDTITLPNGVVLTVATLAVSAVATVTITNAGNVAGTPPANPQAQVSTSGAGTGATFNLTWAATAYCTYMRVNEFLAGNAPDGVMMGAPAVVEAPKGAPKGNPHPKPASRAQHHA